jgi:hypothetical protein
VAFVPPTDSFTAHGVDINIQRTNTGAKATLAVFTVASSGTPSTTPTKVADAMGSYTPTSPAEWHTFTFPEPIQFQSGQAYMIGVDHAWR